MISEVKQKTGLDLFEFMTQISQIQKIKSYPSYKTRFSLDPYLQQLDYDMVMPCSVMSSMQGGLDKITKDILQMEIGNLENLLKFLFPRLRMKGSLNSVSIPFDNSVVYCTPLMKNMITSGEWEFVSKKEKSLKDIWKLMTRQFILHHRYRCDKKLVKSKLLHLRHIETGLPRYFQVTIQNDFVELKTELPDLSKEEVTFYADHITDDKAWKKLIGSRKLLFEGFSFITWEEVTNIETLAQLQNFVYDFDPRLTFTGFKEHILNKIRAYLQDSELEIGLMFVNPMMLSWRAEEGLAGISGNDLFQDLKSDNIAPSLNNCISEEPIYITDLQSMDTSDDKYLRAMQDRDYCCLFVKPVYRASGEIVMVFEIAGKNLMANDMELVSKINTLAKVLEVAFEKIESRISDHISSIIRDKFTAIHKSVQWKFEKVASAYNEKLSNGAGVEIEPIVFKNLMPLYGQADVVGSSSIRNQVIREDLSENLISLLDLMHDWQEKRPLNFLDKFIVEASELLDNLKNRYSSQMETTIVWLLTQKIHPYLERLTSRYNEFTKKSLNQYQKKLDPQLGFIYNKRKNFEESINTLNQTISNFLEKEDEKMQEVLPHYFEKYKTDGVEYTIYLGQDLLQSENLYDFYYSDFKLWQLYNMCELVRLVHRTSATLPLPLKTAQLIFAYNQPFSIRYRLDEKRFDVDGAYNVRYEILKKRIDKAIIKGTNERLTQEGKVAVVYLSDDDKNDYLEYLEYFKRNQIIEPEVEELELENMQGVQGLRALRFAVKLDD